MKLQERDAAKALMDNYDHLISAFTTQFKPPKGLTNSQSEAHFQAHVAAARRYYSTKLKKFFEDEYEKSKGLLDTQIKAINPTVTPQVGAKLVLMHEDEEFQVYYTVRNGPARLDEKKLRMNLVAAGVEPDVVEDAFVKSKVAGNPQTLIDIIPVGETHEDR